MLFTSTERSSNPVPTVTLSYEKKPWKKTGKKLESKIRKVLEQVEEGIAQDCPKAIRRLPSCPPN
jgi:hypothetical protein